MSPKRTSQGNQVFISRAGWYSLCHPIEWRVEEDDTCVELCEPERGVGALHISAYQTLRPVDPRAELLDAFSNDKASPKPENILLTLDGTKRVATFESVTDSSSQKIWFISDKSYLVMVTYNCASENKNEELDIVAGIVDSIELEPVISRN